MRLDVREVDRVPAKNDGMRHEMRGFEDGEMGARLRRKPRRLSQLFARMALKADGPVSVATIRDALGDRSFAALLVFFALFNLLPLPPGASAFLGLPLVIVSAQMVYGGKRAWLPDFIMKKSMPAEQFRSIMERIIPRLVKLERFIRPRYWPFWRKRGDRVIGLIALVMAITVTLPIPLGNWLPAFATALLGLSLCERDGILFAIGSALGVASLTIIVFVIGSVGAIVENLYAWLT